MREGGYRRQCRKHSGQRSKPVRGVKRSLAGLEKLEASDRNIRKGISRKEERGQVMCVCRGAGGAVGGWSGCDAG
jgi:hypothetical protein